MTYIATLIVREIVKRKFQKQAIRIAQRQIGANKLMGLVRRFDKRATFVQNFKDKPYEMLVKMGKQLIKRKIMGGFSPIIRIFNNWRKYGIVECMKRCAFKCTPTELKIPYYFIKDIKTKYELVELITLGKRTFWQEINKLDRKDKARTLNNIVKFKPTNKELKEYWDNVLDKEFSFYAHSPMTHNFEQLPISYNITQQTMYLPIRGYAGTMIKTYKFEQIPWEYVLPAIKGADFGRKIYALFRTANADYYAKYWADKDPHYKK